MKRTVLILLVATSIVGLCAAHVEAGCDGTERILEEGRALSLRVLQQKLQSIPRGSSIPSDIARLCGITRLSGYVIDKEAPDIILVGEAIPSDPPLYLNEFIVALRSANLVYAKKSGNTITYSDPGCTIDPDPKILGQLNDIGQRIHSTQEREKVEKLLQEWHRVCRKPQKVGVFGVPFNSRFAWLMVKADYDMKLLVDGKDSLAVPGFQSLTDMDLAEVRSAVIQGKPINIPLSTMSRFWFYPGEYCFQVDDLGGVIVKLPVVLLAEEEYLVKNKRVQGTGRVDPRAGKFCDRFSTHYDEIADQRPIYRELKNLYRTFAVAKLMECENCFRAAGIDLDYFLHEYRVGSTEVEQKLPGRSNVKRFAHREEYANGYSEVRLWLPSCGGVGMAIECKPSTVQKSRRGQLRRLSTNVRMSRGSLEDLHWNFSPTGKSEIDDPEGSKDDYAFLVLPGAED